MMQTFLAAGDIHGLVDFIPGIHDFYKEFGFLGSSWLNADPLSFNHVVTTLIAMFLVVLLVRFSWNKFKPTPDTALTPRPFFELILDSLYKLLYEQLHDKQKARSYLPLIFGIAIFIFFNNLFALIPGFSPPTDNLNTNVGIALLVFFVSNIAGIRAKGFKGYFAEFLGPIRKWYALPLMLLMLPIELIGQLVRPLTLSIRLMGNMYGDHAVASVLMSLVAAVIPAVVMFMGVIVVTLQTIVFCMLSIIYISLAVSEH